MRPMTTAVQDRLHRIWAKSDPYHSVPCHCIDVGVTAQAILEAPAFVGTVRKLEKALGSSLQTGLAAWIGYLFSLHDYGKCEPHFQGKCPELAEGHEDMGMAVARFEDCRGYRHEWVSAEFLRKRLKELGWERKAIQPVLIATRAHHGNFEPKKHERALDPSWVPPQQELHDVLEELFAPPQWSPKEFPHSGHASMLLCGLLVLSDWIASNSELFGLSHEPGESYSDYAKRARAKAEDCLSEMNLRELPITGPVQDFSEVWKGFTARGLQDACVELLKDADGPGLLLAEAPMGEGKSELSVYAALRLNSLSDGGGFYIALPTAATSNQMYGRISSFVQGYNPSFAKSVRLAHGSAWMVDIPDPKMERGLASTHDEGNAKRWAAEWFRPRRRSMLSPFAVGTVDQAMMAALNVKFGFLRWVGLSGGALIIDEVHAYDTYMRVILERLLEWCGSLEIPVVLLSATLPLELKRSFVSAYRQGDQDASMRNDYPLLSFYPCDGTARFSKHMATTKTYELQVELLRDALDDYPELARVAVEEVGTGGCVCLLMNTVAAAQAVFEVLEGLTRGTDIGLSLFHARFMMKDRERIEQEVLSLFDKRSSKEYRGDSPSCRPEKWILVATQVVEQSLDIDFDVMISQLAPVDLLLQRSGRIHRHDRERPDRHSTPRLLVALPRLEEKRYAFGGSGRVYQHLFLLKTQALLWQRKGWSCPEDFRVLIEDVYQTGSALECDMDSAMLQAAQTKSWEHQENLRTLGARALLYPPDREEAQLVQCHEDARQEAEEGEQANPLAASTRHGDSSRTVYALPCSEALQLCLLAERPPRREKLLELMRGKVSLPSYWLAGAERQAEYYPVERAPKWLGFGDILWLREGQWCGKDRDDRLFRIRYSHRSGFHREVLNG